MKSIVFLYAGFTTCNSFEKLFDSFSAFDLSLKWAGEIDNCHKIVVMASETVEENVKEACEACKDKVEIITQKNWNVSLLLKTMTEVAEREQCDFVVYSFADRPFLNKALTDEIIETHLKYIAEYTTADGYPSGFAPEVIDAGALKIISALADGVKKEDGAGAVLPDSVFGIMKGDINSFDIEAVIAPKDWRLLRLEFSVSQKIRKLACIALYKTAKENNVNFDVVSLSELAETTVAVQKTVPAFYNIQISRNCAIIDDLNPYAYQFKKKYGALPLKNGKPHGQQDMRISDFTELVKQIAEFSDNAVISLSAWGEALAREDIVNYVSAVLEYPGLSVLIETDGVLLTSQVAESIANIVNIVPHRTNRMSAISWIVRLDAATEAKYNQIHMNAADFSSDGKSAFAKANEAVAILSHLFPNEVYPQFTRVNENEDELEAFYRYWHDKNSPSKGKLVIQKYDNFCGKQPDRKPADLAPLHRIPCWHLKRDMTILADGSVPLCREYVLEHSIGNVFDEGIEKIWTKLDERLNLQMKCSYEDKCGLCDEYYTFNF